MNIRDRQAHYSELSHEELAAYMRYARELRSRAISRGVKRLAASLSGGSRRLLRRLVANGHRTCTTS